MSNENKQVLNVLSRLNKSLKKPTAGANQNSNFVDYKALNEERKKAFTKCAPGKTSFIFLTPEGADDPFSEWATHAGLLEQPFWTIDCNHHNKGETCLICSVIEDLRQSDKEKHKPIYNPINKKIDIYAPVINVENEKTIAEGPKWLKISKTVVDQITVWLENLEGDEQPFYSEENPQKVIISYDDKNPVPKDKYKVDKKNAKPFSEEQLAEWKAQIKPLSYYMNSFVRSQDDIKKIVDSYLERTLDKLDSEENANVEPDADSNTDVEVNVATESKLKGLRKGE